MQLLSVTTINIGLILLLIYFIIKGYIKGFISLLFNLASLLMSLFLAWFFYTPLGEMIRIIPTSFSVFQRSILSEFFSVKINSFIWFIIIFIAVFIFLKFLAKVLNIISKAPFISGINRLLGVIFGVVNFWIVSIVFAMILSLPFFTNGSELVSDSLLSYVINYSEKIVPFVEENFNELSAIDILNNKPQQASVSDIENIIKYLEKNKIPIDKINEFIKELSNE